jgi:hypothetical protein
MFRWYRLKKLQKDIREIENKIAFWRKRLLQLMSRHRDGGLLGMLLREAISLGEARKRELLGEFKMEAT